MSADKIDDLIPLQQTLPGVILLTDLKLESAAAWGLREPGAEQPSPATFVVDSTGAIRWRKLGDSRGDWPTYAELAAKLGS